MMDDEIDGLENRALAGKRRIQLARLGVGTIAAGIADPQEARRMAAELNDAYLRLQFALVVDDPRLIRAQRRAWAALLDEAKRGARESDAA